MVGGLRRGRTAERLRLGTPLSFHERGGGVYQKYVKGLAVWKTSGNLSSGLQTGRCPWLTL